MKKLREKLRKCKSGKLIIPKKKPKNFEFAQGLWKSNKGIEDIKTKEPINIYFDIKKSGNGTMKLYLTKSKYNCKAKIDLTFNNSELIIKQSENAKCEKKNKQYNSYIFSCSSIGNEAAICNAKGSNTFSFELIKIK